MENALLIGLSRQIALRREIEVVANNIANLHTTGFKADGAVFEEFMMPGAQHGQFQGGDRRLSYVQDRATWHDFRAGPLQRTGNPLDVAIEGEAFLVVQTPDGERYTRNGALQLNAAGELVTVLGHQVQGQAGPIVFQSTDRDIAISADGTFTVREGSNSKSESTRGRLRLAQFDKSIQLKKDGAGLFSVPENAVPQPPTKFRVVQGAVEQSNVRGMMEMARMVEITRTYSQIASIIQGHHDQRRSAIERLAEVPA